MKQTSQRIASIFLALTASAPLLRAVTLPPLAAGQAPQSIEAMRAGFAPRHEPLKTVARTAFHPSAHAANL